MVWMSGSVEGHLHDQVTTDEIRLVTELMVAASMAQGDLEQQVIDGALGLHPSPESVPAQRRTD
jgi:hypothetical protein